MQERILFLGFGDIAQRCAWRLISRGYPCTGVRRQHQTVTGVTSIQGDCRDRATLTKLLSQRFDVMVMTMTPSEMNDLGYRQAYVEVTQALLHALAQQTYQPRLVIFVSSTSVYGQKQGEWVDETTPTLPVRFNGKRLLEAENLLLSSSYPMCILRCSGIYGPGRNHLIKQVIAGLGATAEPIVYTNRIHADDCAGFIVHLIERQCRQPIDNLYVVTDCNPAPLHQVKQWLAKQLRLPTGHLKPQPLNRNMRSHKRCKNRRLLATGYPLQYPSYREGYTALLNLK